MQHVYTSVACIGGVEAVALMVDGGGPAPEVPEDPEVPELPELPDVPEVPDMFESVWLIEMS